MEREDNGRMPFIMEDKVPFTEQSNPLTYNINVMSIYDNMLDTLHETDLQIFQKHENAELHMLHPEIIKRITNLAVKISELLKSDDPDSKIIFSGCGTSGRLGFIASRKYNQICKGMQRKPLFDYIIAGGDRALLESQESNEDDPISGSRSLEEAITGAKPSLLIGISCGLSAPFVAGQIDFALDQNHNCFPVLIGFNPVNMARRYKIQRWHCSFQDIALQMNEANSILINPVIGPEPITGSSRMKGGSATKMILDTAFMLALSKSYENESIDATALLKAYERSFESTLRQKKSIGKCVEYASNCLSSDGHLYYLGFGYLGFYGILDASECVPTFSADFASVRGFLKDAYMVLDNKEGDLSQMHEHLCISLEYFLSHIIPTLSMRDYVIMFGTRDDTDELQSMQVLLERMDCKMTLILLNTDKGMEEMHDGKEQPQRMKWKTLLNNPSTVCVDIPLNRELSMPSAIRDIFRSSMAELCLKRILNIISTCAHILIGKVLNNHMIDLKVSNEKLLQRAISIIREYSGVTFEYAKDCLLKVIHYPDTLDDALKDKDNESIIEDACRIQRIVPTALLLATGMFTVERAREALDNEKTIRRCLMKVILGKQQS